MNLEGPSTQWKADTVSNAMRSEHGLVQLKGPSLFPVQFSMASSAIDGPSTVSSGIEVDSRSISQFVSFGGQFLSSEHSVVVVVMVVCV